MRTINTEIDQLTTDVKNALLLFYGTRFEKMILYGSYARGDFRSDSDVDLIILLKDEYVNTSSEITKLSPLIADLNLNYNKVISFIPVSSNRYHTRNIPVYVNIRNEGIEI